MAVNPVVYLRFVIFLILAGIIISIFVGRAYCYNKERESNATTVRERDSEDNEEWRYTNEWVCGGHIEPDEWKNGDLRAQVYVAIAAFVLVVLYLVLIALGALGQSIKICEIVGVLFAVMNFACMGVLEAWMGSGHLRIRGKQRWVYVESYIAACVLSFFGFALAIADMLMTAVRKPTSKKTVVTTGYSGAPHESTTTTKKIEKDVF